MRSGDADLRLPDPRNVIIIQAQPNTITKSSATYQVVVVGGGGGLEGQLWTSILVYQFFIKIQIQIRVISSCVVDPDPGEHTEDIWYRK